ncbi:MAG: SRPBCC family protein [Verrucomicrobia bacterium]|nr:SRPBCC family protein [Verrucomicrobiota bacterium]
MGCCNSTVVNAPIEKIWARLRDFHDLSWSPNVVSKVDKVGGLAGTQIGAKRVLNGAFHETLLALDDTEHCIRYSIDDGPAAVAKANVQGYIGEVRLCPVTDANSTLVLWTSRWEHSGGGVAEFCNPVYQALLADLKLTFG